MSKLLERFRETIRQRGLLRPGQKVLVAVSGGVDSMVLLQLLREASPAHQWRLQVAHFNHRLRGRSSAADERLVRRTAARLKLPVVVDRADVRALARVRKVSLEMAARAARQKFLARTAARLKIPTVALAHHADDQVELFLLRLLRGTGGEGLAGMKWRSPSPSNPEIQLVRPLLDLPKSELLDYAAEAGVPFREDATNASLDINRNRIRHELLPLLRSKYQPALSRTVGRLMEIVGTEAEFVAEAARAWLRAPPGRTSFDDLPVALQRRCLQSLLIEQGIIPNFELIEHLRLKPDRPYTVRTRSTASLTSPRQTSHRKAEAAAGSSVRTRSTASLTSPRHTSHRKASEASRTRPPASDPTPISPLDVPPPSRAPRPVSILRDRFGMLRMHYELPASLKTASRELSLSGKSGRSSFAGVAVQWNQAAHRTGQNLPTKSRPGVEFFDAAQLGSRIVLRHWQPGDRFQPIGMNNAVKLQDLFVNQKVPRAQRHRVIVAVTAAGEIFWVEGLRISERFKLTTTTNRRLQWRWQRP